MKYLSVFIFFIFSQDLHAQQRSFENLDKEVFTLFFAILIGIVLIDLFLRSRMSKYIIYERRIDIKTGILFRKHLSCWLYEISNISFTRNPLNIITGDSSITIDADRGLKYKLVGMSAPKTPGQSALKFAQTFFETLRNTVLVERGEIKKMWR